MSLNKQKLVSELKKAFQKNRSIVKSSTGHASKYKQIDCAKFIADAINEYAIDTEIQIPAPSTLLGTTPSTAGIPDPGSSGMKLKVIQQQAKAGKSSLENGINNSFAAGDASMTTISAAIIVYISSLLSFKNTSGAINASGTIAVTTPPIFASSISKGLAGQSEDNVVNEMATMIHSSFSSAVFTGIGSNTAPPATGPIISLLL